MDPGAGAESKLERLRGAFAATGPLAPLAYVAFVAVEVVVAPLPGLLLYAPGGMIFGGFVGGALSTIGNVLGAGIAFFVARSLGRGRVEQMQASAELGRLERRVAARGTLVVFLLRVNPLTSSDLVSYAAGLTSMPSWKLLLGTALGMAPLCWAQAYAAETLLARHTWLVYPLIVAGLGYLAMAVWLLVMWRRRSPASATAGPGTVPSR